ncbi:MAG: PTS mannitol transporter subunit IIABC, partial [Proteobacteria bacterium]|nr:PTS mannitol transporter subunit IIABC [Pseudomonadota bacterium]
TIAAWMNTRYVAKKLKQSPAASNLPADYDIVMLPGLCQGELSVVEEQLQKKVIRGPKDLKDIPSFFGYPQLDEGYGEHQVRILAEIVDAHRLTQTEILKQAEYYRSSGADIIDLGTSVGFDFPQVDKVVSLLKREGHLVSLDSFNSQDILRADGAGIDYLLSINSSNLELAPRLSCQVVLIPDSDQSLEKLAENITRLDEAGVSYIIDPILDPVNFGFMESLHRFYTVRQRYPEAEMLMGLANVTELIDADSMGINALLTGIVTELNIDYILTTEVISWARGSVRELDIARDLMFYSAKRRILPKHIDERLITAKDPPHKPYTEA